MSASHQFKDLKKKLQSKHFIHFWDEVREIGCVTPAEKIAVSFIPISSFSSKLGTDMLKGYGLGTRAVLQVRSFWRLYPH